MNTKDAYQTESTNSSIDKFELIYLNSELARFKKEDLCHSQSDVFDCIQIKEEKKVHVTHKVSDWGFFLFF